MELFCKMTGALLVVGSAWFFAGDKALELDTRLSQIMQLYSILLQLKSELKYMNSTLPECFLELAKHVNAPFDRWLSSMGYEMENERTKCFADIWMERLDELQTESVLSKKEIELLGELQDKLIASDVDASLKAIDYVLIRLEEGRELLKNEMQQRKKVLLSLCLFAGFIIVILLF